MYIESRKHIKSRKHSHAEWNNRLGKETVHATRAIRTGEELTICYLPPGGHERQRRHAQLLAEHGFRCCCEGCELTGDALAASDARQRALGALFRPGEGDLPVAELVKRVDIRLQLLSQEGLPHHWAWKPVLWPLVAGSVTELRRDPSEKTRQFAMAWVRRAYEAMRAAFGKDHRASELAFTLLEHLVALHVK